jgi:hypothetical protein
VTAALLCLGVLPQTFQRLDVDHVAFSLALALPLAVTAGAHLSSRGRWTAAVRPSLVVVAVSLVTVIISVLPLAQRPWVVGERLWVGDRSTLVASAERTAMSQLLDSVHRVATPGSRVFVGAQDLSVPTLTPIGLYHLLPEYTPATYYLELPPGVSERAGSGLARDLESADLLVLATVPADLNRRLFPRFAPGSTEGNNAVEAHFCPRDTTPLGELYVRCR